MLPAIYRTYPGLSVDDLADMPAGELAALLRALRLTCMEVTDGATR